MPHYFLYKWRGLAGLAIVAAFLQSLRFFLDGRILTTATGFGALTRVIQKLFERFGCRSVTNRSMTVSHYMANTNQHEIPQKNGGVTRASNPEPAPNEAPQLTPYRSRGQAGVNMRAGSAYRGNSDGSTSEAHKFNHYARAGHVR